jgi:hypothetical protein
MPTTSTITIFDFYPLLAPCSPLLPVVSSFHGWFVVVVGSERAEADLGRSGNVSEASASGVYII